MSTKMNEVWEIIDGLEPNEKKIIYKRLRDDIRLKMNDILDKVNERVGEEIIDFKEITEEVELVREANYGKN